MEPSRYIVALRRGGQTEAPPDWVDRIAAMPGVSVIGATSKRAQVAADDEGIRLVRDAIGSYTHIEPLITHHTS